jgi:hypothetical protein
MSAPISKPETTPSTQPHFGQKIGFISHPREKILAQEEVLEKKEILFESNCWQIRVLDLLEDYVEVEEDEVVD